jgi:hypothetical protein
MMIPQISWTQWKNPEHEGSKHNRKFPDHELGLAWEIDGPRWQDYHRKIIYDALMKKKNEKYDNYWLSVVVNDSKYFDLNENPQSLKPVIDRVLQNNKDLFKIFPQNILYRDRNGTFHGIC